MINKFIDIIVECSGDREQSKSLFTKKEVDAKTILLKEGEVSRNIFFVEKGCLREWFNKEGKDITFQFFFEGSPVASIDSFMNREPSLFTIESIEPSIVYSITKEDFDSLMMMHPVLKDKMQEFIFHRFRHYGQLFLSRIKDTPSERYQELIKLHPEIVRRIPQHYIASYLGITPVSLSRIRNRKTD